MREALSFACDGAVLAATLDRADGAVGLLIVSGGNEVRSGAHRGMARLAAEVAAAGHPVLRFDRRGIGDSEGDNGGFEASRDDIAAAIAAFRAACPKVTQVAAFGNCDAASALVLHQPLAVDALILANPWTIEAADAGDAAPPALPPASAIRARYLARLRDPASLVRLIKGEVDVRRLLGGLLRLVRPAPPPTADALGPRVCAAIVAAPQPVTLLLAERDRTAQAFAEHMARLPASARAALEVKVLDSASHSFAGDDADWLRDQLLSALRPPSATR
jgi:exosortase A-associated hydrolase 1